MTEVLLEFGFAAVLIIAAGTLLVRFADRIADETGWGRLFVGSLVLAGATSLPELMVDLNAIRLGQPDLAVGDLMGSSLFNLLILAAMDTIFRNARRAFTGEFVAHAQNAVLAILLSSLVAAGILSQVDLSFFGVGLFVWFVALVYLLGMKLGFGASIDREAEEFKKAATEGRRRRLLMACLGLSACALVILLASPMLIRAADQFAVLSSLGHTFVGTTLVALATSLPELVATLAAFRMGAPDLALGNVFGSNTFNMVLLFPLDALQPGALLSQVRPVHALTAVGVMAVSSVAVLGQISRKRTRARLYEPSSELVLVMCLSYLYLLYRVTGH